MWGALKGAPAFACLLPRLPNMAYQGFTAEYLGIPAVTRAYTTACVITTAAVVTGRLMETGGGCRFLT